MFRMKFWGIARQKESAKKLTNDLPCCFVSRGGSLPPGNNCRCRAAWRSLVIFLSLSYNGKHSRYISTCVFGWWWGMRYVRVLTVCNGPSWLSFRKAIIHYVTPPSTPILHRIGVDMSHVYRAGRFDRWTNFLRSRADLFQRGHFSS